MKIANIYSVANQRMYRKEDFVMILAHIMQAGLYDPMYFSNKQYVIMDNGLYENAQVSLSLEPLIQLVEKQPIHVDELIVPDAMGDMKKTVELFQDNYDIMLCHNEFKYMFVAQAKDLDELEHCINYVNNFSTLKLTLGIPKKTPWARDCPKAIELYKKCKVPIHFLGIKSSYEELFNVKNIIRSCDSAQLMYITRDMDYDGFDHYKYTRRGNAIDLIKDAVDAKKLRTMRKILKEELLDYGIL